MRFQQNKYMKTLIVFLWIAALAVSVTLNSWVLVNPIVGPHLAAQAVNGGDNEFIASHAYQGGTRALVSLEFWASLAIFLIPLGVTMWYRRVQINKVMQRVGAAMLLLLMLNLGGCMKAYKTPQYVEVKPSQTAFFIPLVGDNKAGQAKFDSKTYEAFKKIGVKRLEVPQEWLPTGRMENNGKWVPSARVVIVDRSSVTREWTKSLHSGSKSIDQAVSVESQDSVNFSLGFKVTAYIAEEDTSTFLYYNASRVKEDASGRCEVVGLDEVMDTEVLSRLQKVAAREFGQYPMDVARTKKAEVYAVIDTEVIPFFKERGITIMTIAQLGGLSYDNIKIQEAIDKTVMDQQEKVSALAAFDAQQTKNKTIKLSAEAEAAATLTKAEGEAKGKLAVQKAIAEGITAVNEATKASGSSEVFFKLKELEVQMEFAKASKGNVPAILITGENKGGSGTNFPLSLPPDVLKNSQTPAK